MNAQTPIFEATNLHTYLGASHILHGINLTVRPGETLSMMGRNGMGKTTTLRTLLGLAPAAQGKVRVYGDDVTRTPTHKIINRGIAYVPEDRGIFPNLTVEENLKMAARAGVSGRQDWTYERVLEVFPRLGQRLHHMGNNLSGGEQQMLTVGRALMTNPELIILDEATEGLAPLIRQEIWSVIEQIKQTGIAAIIVDKDVKALTALADRNLIICKGQVVFDGSSEELQRDPSITATYLGV